MGDQGYTPAAAVPVPDAGVDTLREQLASTIRYRAELGREPDTGAYTATPENLADALLPLIREHIATARRLEREALITQLELMVKFPASDAPYSKGSADGFNTAVHDLLSLLRVEATP